MTMVDKYCKLIQEHIDYSRKNHKKFNENQVMFWSEQIHDYCAQQRYFNSLKKNKMIIDKLNKM